MLQVLSEEQWQHWETEGYVRLGVQLTAEEVAQLQQRCDELMMGTADGVDFSMLRMVREKPEGGIRDGVGEDIGHRGATLEYSKFQGLEHDPVFRRLMSQPLMRYVKQHNQLPRLAVLIPSASRVGILALIAVSTALQQLLRFTERRCSTNQHSQVAAGSVGSEPPDTQLFVFVSRIPRKSSSAPSSICRCSGRADKVCHMYEPTARISGAT